MLNSKVEHCPVCGKIRNKSKPCKHCGFDGGETIKLPTSEDVDNMIGSNNKYSYFVFYVLQENNSFSFGNVFVSDCFELNDDVSIKSLQEQLKSYLGVDDVTIINFIKL